MPPNSFAHSGDFSKFTSGKQCNFSHTFRESSYTRMLHLNSLIYSTTVILGPVKVIQRCAQLSWSLHAKMLSRRSTNEGGTMIPQILSHLTSPRLISNLTSQLTSIHVNWATETRLSLLWLRPTRTQYFAQPT